VPERKIPPKGDWVLGSNTVCSWGANVPGPREGDQGYAPTGAVITGGNKQKKGGLGTVWNDIEGWGGEDVKGYLEG